MVLSINAIISDSNFTNNQGYLSKDIIALTQLNSINNLFDDAKVYKSGGCE